MLLGPRGRSLLELGGILARAKLKVLILLGISLDAMLRRPLLRPLLFVEDPDWVVMLGSARLSRRRAALRRLVLGGDNLMQAARRRLGRPHALYLGPIRRLRLVFLFAGREQRQARVRVGGSTGVASAGLGPAPRVTGACGSVAAGGSSGSSGSAGGASVDQADLVLGVADGPVARAGANDLNLAE